MRADWFEAGIHVTFHPERVGAFFSNPIPLAVRTTTVQPRHLCLDISHDNRGIDSGVLARCYGPPQRPTARTARGGPITD